MGETSWKDVKEDEIVIFSCITVNFTAKSFYSIIARRRQAFLKKNGKGSTKHMHQARAYSTKPRDVMAESKGKEAIVPKHPKTRDHQRGSAIKVNIGFLQR